MFHLFRSPLVLSILATLLIWLGAVIFWQEVVAPTSLGEIGFYLVGLPMLTIAAGFGLRAGYRRFSQPQAPEQNPAAAPAAPATADQDEAERGFRLAVLAAGVVTGAGTDPAETYGALRGKEIRPDVDELLRNRDGFPVVLSRVAEVDTAEAEEAFSTSGGPLPAIAVLRATALLREALGSVADALRSLAPLPRTEPERAAGDGSPAPRLLVDIFVPPAWDQPLRETVQKQIETLLGTIGWPSESIVAHAHPAAGGTLALRRLDAFCLEANRGNRRDYALFLACESAIDEDAIADLEDGGSLFDATRPQGHIPGEGAAALLVCSPAATTPAAPPLASIGRILQAGRTRSADAPGRVSHEILLQIGQGALAAAQVAPDAVGVVVSDIDQRTSRCVECAGALNDLLPDLDPVEQSFGIGQSLGRLETAGPLLALGVAVGAVQADAKPALVNSALHATERACAVVQPFRESEPGPSAGA